MSAAVDHLGDRLPADDECSSCGEPLDAPTWCTARGADRAPHRHGRRVGPGPAPLRDEQLTDRPWRGQCATTGLTLDAFRERLGGTSASTLPDPVLRASVSICRSYGIKGWSDPGYIANVIGGELARAGVIPCTTDGHEHGRGCQR